VKAFASGFALLVILVSAVSTPAGQSVDRGSNDEAGNGPAWLALGHGMEKMKVEMMSIRPSGNSDVDFVKLMLPHHQAAIDMAKTELEYGKDPQVRRLAQEIVTDQQSETDLMQLWLKQHEPNPQK
jgi:uncharacterized protein (DUF305 family)